MKRAAWVIGVFVAVSMVGSPAWAAPNPSGTGQPKADCADFTSPPPPGFTTAGFANAESHYAGSDGTPSLRSGNEHAVSQYDVACFQVSQH